MWIYNNNELEYYSDELYHYGVLGMKWGVHKSTYRTGSDVITKRKAKRQAIKDFAKTDSNNKTDRKTANAAAKTYYKRQNVERKRERTNSFKTYRNLGTKSNNLSVTMDRQIAGLSEAQVKAGRYRIAKGRNARRTVLSAGIGAASTLALASSGAFVFGAAGGLGAYAISRQVTGGRRYKKEQRSYERYAAKK